VVIMGYPDLKSDESIVLTAQHVKVKSVPFELVLTNRRLIIIDSEKNVVPTQQISLVTIRNVTVGENAIRDPVITLTILTDTADTREMALSFVRQTAGERRREADEWVKSLKKNVAAAVSNPVEAAMDIPVTGEARPDHTGTPGTKKKIEIARPIKKITVDASHLPPKPVETTSLPEGSFCARCGNRIPPGSTFCNRCGTKVVVPGEATAVSAAPGQIATAPVSGPGDRKGRPIEQIIHSIEPLIADSVPRTEAAPAVPEPVQVPPAEPPTAPATPVESPTDAFAAAAAAVAATGQEAPAIPPVPPIPPVPGTPRKKSRRTLAVAVIIIVILAVVGGGFVVMTNLNKNAVVTPVTTPVPTTATPRLTAVPTAVATTIAVPTTPQVVIPQTGVWAEITYDKTYTGLVGAPGNQVQVTDTGDHFYRIPTSDGTVAISLQKSDGSGDPLKVVVYSDGATVKTASTTTPYGNIDVQLSLATPTPPPTSVITTVATQSPASNVTTSIDANAVHLTSTG
jgi:hypothetical protein